LIDDGSVLASRNINHSIKAKGTEGEQQNARMEIVLIIPHPINKI
jgi:hypothetical protein